MNPSVSVFLLNREVVCSRSAAGSAGFAASSFVLLTEPPVRTKQQPVRAAVWDRRAAGLSAPGAVAVSVGPDVSAILGLIVTCLLPSGRVAAHLEEVCLVRGGGHVVLLGGHVL